MASEKDLSEFGDRLDQMFNKSQDQINDLYCINRMLQNQISGNTEKFEEIFGRQVEVSVGRRNVNCLFCADPGKTQGPESPLPKTER